MLRKKLSKLIVAVMAAVMLSGGTSGVGQAVFANTSAEVVTTEARTPVDIDATTNTTDEEVIKHIKDTAVSTLKVTRELVLTSTIVDEINSRTAPLTIEVGQGGSLIIDSAINLDGKNSLKLVRTDNKSGAILSTRNPNTGTTGIIQATIKGVIFENKSITVDAPYFINDTGNNFSVTLEGNTIVSGVLAYDRRPTGQAQAPVTNFKNNNVGNGSITALYTLDAGINHPVSAGSTIATVVGTVSGNLATEVTGTAKITITDSKGSVVKTSKDLSITNTVNSVKELFEGLTPGANYGAFIEINVKDKDGNSYTRKSASVQFTTVNFSSTVTNITGSSATININHGTLPPSSYDLSLTVTGGTAAINPPSITSTTNSVNLTGLASNTSYTYEIKDKSGNVIDKGTFRTTSSTISGSGSTGGSVVSGDLTTNDINKADIKDVSASIPVGNSTLANSLRDGKDYKTNIEGVTVTYSNGKVELSGLVPEKDYRDLTITYTDKDGRTRTVKVPSFKTKVSETKLRQFIVDVYKYSLGRTPDERGFAYWEDQLSSKKTSPADFVKNLLNEKEFIEKHKTTTDKIEALYQVIVNRSSDSQGLSFWTKKYDDLVARGYSESMALRVVVDEMVNEQEFKNRVKDLGL